MLTKATKLKKRFLEAVSKSEKIKEMIENGHKDWTFATGGPFLGALQEKLKAVKEPKGINKYFMSTFLAEDSKQVRTKCGNTYRGARLQDFMGLEGVIKKLEEEHARLVETRIAQQKRYSSPLFRDQDGPAEFSLRGGGLEPLYNSRRRARVRFRIEMSNEVSYDASSH